MNKTDNSNPATCSCNGATHSGNSNSKPANTSGKITDSKPPRLTAKEEEIMRILWENGPSTVKEVLEFFPEPRPHTNTVSTVIRVLEKKGFIGHEKEGSGFRYHPLLAKENYRKTSLLDMLRNYFDNNLKTLVSALVEEKSLSDDEIRDCIDIIEKRK